MSGVTGQQNKQDNTPRIQIEEEEIILFDDRGKELKKLYVGKNDPEKERVLQQNQEKVLKIIGAKHIQDIRDSKQYVRFNEENRKLLKIKQIDKPKMKFIDKQGKVLKELHLTMSDKPDIKEVTRKIHGIEKNVVESKEITGILSKENNYALVNTHRSLIRIEGGDIVDLEYYSIDGKVLWSKQLPENMGIANQKVSENGEIVAYIQGFITGNLDAREYYEKLVVINKKGEEIMNYPKKRDDVRLRNDISMSDNGCYIGISLTTKNNQIVSMFFDVLNNKSWVSEKHYVVNSISNNGILNANIVTFNPHNLKEVTRKEEIVDLKSVFRE